MGDIAQILSGSMSTNTSFRARSNVLPESSSSSAQLVGKPAAKKKVSREVSALLGGASDELLPPIAPSKKITLGGFKAKRGAGRSNKWVWKSFTSSARKDGLALSHWVRADAEFVDYPFARFSKRIDVLRYTDAEYRDLCTPKPEAVTAAGDDPSRSNDQDVRWDKEATDHLFDLVRRYDVRWPIIYDRFDVKHTRYLEDMKLRFYTVTARVLAHRRKTFTQLRDESGLQGLVPFREYEGFLYNPAEDTRRRRQLESAFRRTNVDLAEERKLLNELKGIEVSIRRIESKVLRGAGASAASSSGMARSSSSSSSSSSGGGGGAGGRRDEDENTAMTGSSSDAPSATTTSSSAAGGNGGVASSSSSSSSSNNVMMTSADYREEEGEEEQQQVETAPGAARMARRNLALKKRMPYLFPVGDPAGIVGGAGGSSGGTGGGDPYGTSQGGGGRSRGRGGAGGGGGGGGGAGLLSTTPVYLDYNPFAKVGLRSHQIIAPLDGFHPDSTSLAKVAAVLKEAHVPDRPLPTAEVLRHVSQLRREVISHFQQSKELKEVEEEVYRLHKIREEATLNPGAMSMSGAYAGQAVGSSSAAAAARAQAKAQAQAQTVAAATAALQQRQRALATAAATAAAAATATASSSSSTAAAIGVEGVSSSSTGASSSAVGAGAGAGGGGEQQHDATSLSVAVPSTPTAAGEGTGGLAEGEGHDGGTTSSSLSSTAPTPSAELAAASGRSARKRRVDADAETPSARARI